MRIIPISFLLAVGIAAALAEEGTGLTGIYYANKDFSGKTQTRIDPQIDYSWGSAGTGLAGVGPNNFSVCWQGQILPSATETYTFYTVSDDGIMVWVNDQLVIQNWTNHPSTENSGTISLVSGIKYDIRIKYFQGIGDSTVNLSWSSPSISKQLIQPAFLFPTVANQHLALTSEIISRTSPAWLEGTMNASTNLLEATVGFHPASVKRESLTTWFVDSSPDGSPPGVLLDPSAPTHVTLRADADSGQDVLAADLTWAVTDLSNLPYGLEKLSVRVNDQLLLSATGKSMVVEIDTDYDGVNFHPCVTGNSSSEFKVTFPTAGSRCIIARCDGNLTALLTVTTIAVGFNGPIADEEGFQRQKDVTIFPVTEGQNNVVFVANDPDWFSVSTGMLTSTGATLELLPIIRGDRVVQARLGSIGGPVIAHQKVDTFSIETSATQSIHVYQVLDDGSQLAEASLTMKPWIPDLQVTLQTFASGVTFDDSTTTRTVLTNAFSREQSHGVYNYHMLRAPTGYANFCHSFVVTQNGIQISF